MFMKIILKTLIKKTGPVEQALLPTTIFAQGKPLLRNVWNITNPYPCLCSLRKSIRHHWSDAILKKYKIKNGVVLHLNAIYCEKIKGPLLYRVLNSNRSLKVF